MLCGTLGILEINVAAFHQQVAFIKHTYLSVDVNLQHLRLGFTWNAFFIPSSMGPTWV